MTVPEPQRLEKKENQHKSSPADISTFWSLPYIYIYICIYVSIYLSIHLSRCEYVVVDIYRQFMCIFLLFVCIRIHIYSIRLFSLSKVHVYIHVQGERGEVKSKFLLHHVHVCLKFVTLLH